MVLTADRLSMLGYLGQIVPPEPSDPGGGDEVLLGALPEGDWAGAGACPYTPNDGSRVCKSCGFAHPTLLREISVELQRASRQFMQNEDCLLSRWPRLFGLRRAAVYRGLRSALNPADTV